MITPTTEELNALTDAGLISDEAIFWADVAECDRERAEAWILDRRARKAQEENE